MRRGNVLSSIKVIVLLGVLCYMPKACSKMMVSDTIDAMPEGVATYIAETHPQIGLDGIARIYNANPDSVIKASENCNNAESEREDTLWNKYCAECHVNPQHPTKAQEDYYGDVWLETDEAE